MTFHHPCGSEIPIHWSSPWGLPIPCSQKHWLVTSATRPLSSLWSSKVSAYSCCVLLLPARNTNRQPLPQNKSHHSSSEVFVCVFSLSLGCRVHPLPGPHFLCKGRLHFISISWRRGESREAPSGQSIPKLHLLLQWPQQIYPWALHFHLDPSEFFLLAF